MPIRDAHDRTDAGTPKRRKVRVKPRPKVVDFAAPDTVEPITRPERRAIDKRARDAQIRHNLGLQTQAKPLGRPKAKPLSRDEELALAIDIAMGREPAFKASAKATKPRHGLAGALELATGVKYGDTLFTDKYGRRSFSDPWDYANLGMLLPFGRPIAGVRAGVRGAAALPRGAKAAKAAAAAEYAGPGLIRRGLGRTAGHARWRDPLRSNQLGLRSPAAKSQLGRGAEALIDAVSTEGMKVRKAAKNLNASEITQRRLDQSAAVELKRYAKKLPVEQMYAIRALASGVTPPERKAFHMDELTKTDDVLSKYAHSVHADLNDMASKYLWVNDQGVLDLVPDAPKNLQRAWGLYQQVYKDRERIYRDLDVLLESTMNERVQATGKIMKGGRWMENEVFEKQGLALSEPRGRIVEGMEKLVDAGRMTRQGITSTMTVMDGAARSWAQRERKRVARAIEYNEKKLERAADPIERQTYEGRLQVLREREARGIWAGDYYNDFGAVYTQLPPQMVEAIFGPDARFMADSSREIAAKFFEKYRLKLPPELSNRKDLEAAIAKVFALAQEGAEHKDWYDRAAGQVMQVSEMTGVDPKKVAQLFAIFSQASDTVVNVSFLKTAIDQWKTYGKIYAGRFPERQGKEAEAVMRGENWEGRKRSSFYQNIIELIDPSEVVGKPVTVDRWVVRMFTPESGKDVPAQYYDTFEKLIQEMAARVGWEPKEVQAAAWVSTKAKALEESARRGPRHRAGGQDAFEYGVEKYFGQTALELGDAGVANPDALRAANAVRKPDGGFTLHKDLTDAKPTGYVVAYGAHEFRVPANKIQGHVIEAYRDANADLLGRKNTYVGGWHNGADGNVYLDVSKEYQTKAAALKFGREQGQLSIFDAKAAARGDWDNAFPSTGLTEEEADAIKRSLKGGQPPIPQTLRQLEAPVIHPDVKAFDDMLVAIAKQLDVPYRGDKNIAILRQRIDEIAAKYPDHPWVQNYEAMEAKAQAAVAPDLDEVFGPEAPRGTGPGGEFVYGKDSPALRPGYGTRLSDETLREMDDARQAAEIREMLGGADEAQARKFGPDYPEQGGYSEAVGRTLPTDPEWLAAAVRGENPIGGAVLGPREGTKGLFLSEKYGKDWVGAHELFHYLEDQMSPRQLATLRKVLGDNDEDLVEAFETWVLQGAGGRKDLEDAFKSLGEIAYRDLNALGREVDQRPILPRRAIEIFDDVFNWDDLRGGAIRGAEHHTGVAKEPFKRGLPLPLRKDLRNWKLHVSLMKGNRSAIGQLWSDPTTKKQMKGLLLKSGLFTADVLRTAGEEVGKALKLASAARVRQALISQSTDLPRSPRDIAIKLNPKQTASPALSRYYDLIADIDDGMDLPTALAQRGLKAEKLFNKSQLRELENSQIDDFVSELLPGGPEIDDLKAAMLAKDQGAVDNIRWVDPDLIERSELFEPPNLRRMQMNAWTKLARTGVWSIDVANDLLRTSLLYLNPAYYPVNLMGNLMMNLMQQGVFMPLNLAKAARANWDLALGHAQVIDELMGKGFAGALELKAVTSRPSSAMNNVANMLVDRIPRRAAWLHEARTLGYRDSAAISKLIDDARAGVPKAREDLELITNRAQDEIVNFDNLSTFERDKLSRLIFVYPWLKGATSYTLRFPFNHPVQTAAYIGLYERQQAMAQQEIGDRPDYLNLFMPVGTAERFGDEYPYGINLRQAFTQSTPLDIAKSVQGAFTGDRGSTPLTEFAQPFYSTVLSALTGYDPFLDKKVPRGLVPLLQSVAGQVTTESPLGQGIERIARSDEERARMAQEGALYPRNRTDDILRSALGSFMTGPVNVETSGRRAREGQAQSTENKMKDFLADSEKVFGELPPPAIAKQYAQALRYDEIQGDLRKELGTSALGSKGTATARLRLLAETTNADDATVAGAEEAIQGMTDAEAESYARYLWERLGFENETYREWVRRVEDR